MRRSHSQVGAVTPLRILPCSLEQLVSLTGEGLDQLRVAHLSQQEVAELTPVRLLAVQLERVLPFIFQSRVIAPEMPVTALYSSFLFRLSGTHSPFQSVTDTG